MQVALLDGEPIIAFDLTEAEFEAVRIRTPLCRTQLKTGESLMTAAAFPSGTWSARASDVHPTFDDPPETADPSKVLSVQFQNWGASRHLSSRALL